MALRISTSLSVVLFSCFAAMPVQAQGALDAMIAAAQAEGALMVYHTSPMPIIELTFRAFEKKYGIKVQNYHATGNPLTVRFSSEAAAGQMIADVIYASDTTSYLRFPELFQQLTSENYPGYDRLPDEARLDFELGDQPFADVVFDVLQHAAACESRCADEMDGGDQLKMEGPGDAGRSTVIGDLPRRLLCAAQGSPSAADTHP